MTDENERLREKSSAISDEKEDTAAAPVLGADGMTDEVIDENAAPAEKTEEPIGTPETEAATETEETHATETADTATDDDRAKSDHRIASENEDISVLPVPAPPAESKKEPKPRSVDSRFDLAELFIFSLVAVLLLSAFIFRHTVVDGGSMENTLHDGENLIISDLFYTPKTGDIVVVEDYHTPFRKPLIKRVIATGGQTVMILPTGVYVDGFLLEEDYVHTEPGYRYTPVPEFTVPDGMIYIMGDHRDNSTDSRAFGCVSEEAILGRVLLRYFPFSRFGTVD